MPAGFDAYAVFTDTWASADNVLGDDFELFGSDAEFQLRQGPTSCSSVSR